MSVFASYSADFVMFLAYLGGVGMAAIWRGGAKKCSEWLFDGARLLENRSNTTGKTGIESRKIWNLHLRRDA